MNRFIDRGNQIIRRSIPFVLIVSLSVNLLLVGGFLYQRHVVQPRLQTAWATKELHLDTHQQADLQQLNEWARSNIKQGLNELGPAIAAIRQGIREGRAEDPEFRAAIRHISERRLEMQMETLKRVIAFRDTLDPEQRQTFIRLAGKPGFVRQLLGIAQIGKEAP